MKFNPIFIILKSISLLLMKRVWFPKERVGTTIVVGDREYIVFRQVVMNTKSTQSEIPDGIFRVWFFTKMSSVGTICLSWLTLLGFIGLPGFHSKLWLVNKKTKEFGGIYEWDTVQDAHNYNESYAMKFSKWRSIPGKFRTEVFSQDDPRAKMHQTMTYVKR